jgi:RHS repeat-associated protein
VILLQDKWWVTSYPPYQLAGRLDTRKYYNASDVLQDTDTYTYTDSSGDETARLVSAAKGRYSNTVSYTYDAIDRPATETLNMDSTDYTVGYEYDDAGRLATLVYPDSSEVLLDYTDRHQLDTVDYDVDADGLNLQSIIDLAYADNGRETSRAHGNGLSTTRSYTRDDNLVTSITCGTSVTDFDYTYDDNKNPTAQTDNIMSAHSWSTGASGYDAEDRLTNFDKNTYNAFDQFWTLTDVGDWSSNTFGGTAQVRTHSDAHEIATVASGTLTHDAKGNLTLDEASQAYTWDQDNHLAAADTDNDSTDDVDYEYDALGRRVKKTTSSLTTIYISCTKQVQGRDRGQVLAEYEDGGSGYSLVRKFIYGSYIDEPLAMIDVDTSETLYYYHRNNNFNVVAITDSSGNVVERYTYTAYGQPLILTGAGTDSTWGTGDDVTASYSSIDNPYTFTGRRLDEETGLMYYYARYYSTPLGRFISRDPLEYVDGMSVYEYGRGVPTINHDAKGTYVSRAEWNTAVNQLDNALANLKTVDGVYAMHSHFAAATGAPIRIGHSLWKAIRRTKGYRKLAKKVFREMERRAKRVPCGETREMFWNDSEETVTANLHRYSTAEDIALALTVGSFRLGATTYCEASADYSSKTDSCDSGCGCDVDMDCETVYTISDRFTFRTYKGNQTESGMSKPMAAGKAICDAYLMTVDLVTIGTVSGNVGSAGKDFYMFGMSKSPKKQFTIYRCDD